MIVYIAVVGSVISRVYPMPLVAKSAFGGVSVVVCPGCCEADAVVVVWFEYLIESGLCGRG